MYSSNLLSSTSPGFDSDSWIQRPFTIECILPGQLTGRCRPRTGEERLLLAVLEDAINCFFGDDRKGQMEATVWFKERKADDTFSFENICAVLGFDAGWLRKGLFKHRDAVRKETSTNPGLMRFSRAA